MKQYLNLLRSIGLSLTLLLSILSSSVARAQSSYIEVSRIGLGSTNAVAWHPDTNTLAVGGNSVTWLYDENLNTTAHLNAAINTAAERLSSLAWSPDGNWLAVGISGDPYSRIQIWNSTTQQLQQAIQDPTATDSVALAWSPDSQKLATGSGANIKLWNAQTGQLQNTLTGHTSVVNTLTWSPSHSDTYHGEDKLTEKGPHHVASPLPF